MPDLRVIDKLSEDFPDSWNKSSIRKIAEVIAGFLKKNNVEVNDFDIGKFVIIIKSSDNLEKIARQIIAFKKIVDQSDKFNKNIISIIKDEFEKEIRKDFDELKTKPQKNNFY
jgi:hypothetical protein